MANQLSMHILPFSQNEEKVYILKSLKKIKDSKNRHPGCEGLSTKNLE